MKYKYAFIINIIGGVFFIYCGLKDIDEGFDSILLIVIGIACFGISFFPYLIDKKASSFDSNSSSGYSGGDSGGADCGGD